MYPHERSLVNRLADKPFALLGINSDADRQQLKKVIAEHEINWRSWWDESPTGPIQTEWQVAQRPTLYVIDAEGIIRHKNISEQELDKAVEALIEKASQP